jgi:hypothetical protein
LDVQTRRLTETQTRRALWTLGLALVLVLGLVLRLKGVHNPLLDHPGWRQGDEASIARNFATLQYNILYPQTNYDGPPPNYVELELQIVPFLAATLYKIFGVHEIFGRLITIAFSLGTVALLALFGRWLFSSAIAGVLAALFYAIMPGSVYYGRTFTPDAVMVFFMTAALYALCRLGIDEERWRPRTVLWCAVLLTLALLAKPVAIVAIVPVLVLMIERIRSGRTFAVLPATAVLLIPLLIFWLYDKAVAAHAEWHWTSGIFALHVLPALQASLQSGGAFFLKFERFHVMLGEVAHTMIGPGITALAVLGFLLPPRVIRSRSLLWSWLAAGLAYVYVVVTVERVDYYMFLLLPLAALTAAGFITRLIGAMRQSTVHRRFKYLAAAAGLLALAAIEFQNIQIVKPYYAYSKTVYRNATTLNKTLAPNVLVVVGHFDPSVLYYIGRYGWEEDPYVWILRDERSAIRKGARYFIVIEKKRFYRNIELCAFMQRFPVLNPQAQWPVYITDLKRIKPGTQKAWLAFRKAEHAHRARQWLTAHGLCTLTATEAASPKLP